MRMISEHKFPFSSLFSDTNDARVVEFDANDTMALTPTVTVLKRCSAVNCYIQSSCHVGHTTALFVSVGIDETLISIL